ncbi:MAG: CHRD domain-containing protein [Opitutus sp.]|nr:CHRD domain-containing protein [Opitutus sp.]
MKITSVRGLLVAGALCALAVTARAQIVQLRATINSAQENPDTRSPATGNAIMFYNVATNTFDLMVSINGLTNLASASHLHEAPAGTNGGVVTTLGAEAVYTRTSTALTATFRDIKHGGSPLTLLRGGAYYNIHSTQFGGGEVRGQLIAQPVRLYSHMTIAQEAAANPTLNFTGLNDFGGAIVLYDPAANTISLRSSVYNFNNTLNNSHIHEGAVGVSAGVVHSLGNNPNAGIYSNTSGAIQGSFDGPYLGDPVKLISGGAYLNYHSNVFGGGELRGQVLAAQEIPSTRFINLSVRGFVGTGEQALISGIVVNGTEPVRTLITAKGPSLSAFGIAAPLANPILTIFDSAGRQIARNDDVGAIAAGSELANIPGVPRNAVESALVLVLPPGNYTAIVSAAAGTGIAILEVNDLRTLPASVTTN